MANEKRLIYVDDAVKAVCDNCSLDYRDCNRNNNLCADCSDILNLPTVDAVEVVHAEWACVNESDNVWMCAGKNGCGNEILLLEETPTENGFHYCPSCGAKMDGERREGQ